MASLKERLLKGVGANFFGQVVSVGIQLISVPFFLHFWGKALYGEWLILTAIPTYLSMSDIGFTSVAGNEMTMLTAKGDRKGAVTVFQSVWLMVSVVSFLIGAIVVALLLLLPVRDYFNVSLISSSDTNLILLVLSGHVLLSLQGGIFDSGFRCDGNYALGTMIGNAVRLIEWICAFSMLIYTNKPLAVALALLSGRVIGLVISWGLLHRKSPWLRFGFMDANFDIIRRLVKPAVAFMAFPLGLALSIQGMTLVIGSVLGPVAVALFTTYRTVSRMVVQLITMINRAVWPEISAAFGMNNLALARRLHSRASVASFWSAVAVTAFLALFGQWIINLWTSSAFTADYLLLNLLLVVTIANALWQTSWVALMATNSHNRIAVVFIIGSGVSIGLAMVLMPFLGISGAALSLLSIDCCMVVFAVKGALSILQDDTISYMKSFTNLELKTKVV